MHTLKDIKRMLAAALMSAEKGNLDNVRANLVAAHEGLDEWEQFAADDERPALLSEQAD